MLLQTSALDSTQIKQHRPWLTSTIPSPTYDMSGWLMYAFLTAAAVTFVVFPSTPFRCDMRIKSNKTMQPGK